MKQKSSSCTAFNTISHWDFLNPDFIKETQEIKQNSIPIVPIPMSYIGEMTMEEILNFVAKRKEFEMDPIHDGDNQIIYCFSRDLAKELLKNGHLLLLDKKKVQWLAGAEKKQNVNSVLKRVDDELIEKWDFLNPEFISNDVIKVEGSIPTVPIPMSMEGEVSMDQIHDFITENETIPIAPIFSGDESIIYCFSRSLANTLLDNGHTLMMDSIKIQFVKNN